MPSYAFAIGNVRMYLLIGPKTRTNRRFSKTHPDAQTKAKKEDVSGKPGRMVTLRRSNVDRRTYCQLTSIDDGGQTPVYHTERPPLLTTICERYTCRYIPWQNFCMFKSRLWNKRLLFLEIPKFSCSAVSDRSKAASMPNTSSIRPVI